jgi:hypothetical protein
MAQHPARWTTDRRRSGVGGHRQEVSRGRRLACARWLIGDRSPEGRARSVHARLRLRNATLFSGFGCVLLADFVRP